MSCFFYNICYSSKNLRRLLPPYLCTIFIWVSIPTEAQFYYIFMLSKRVKENVAKGVKRHDADTGSPEVQVALITRQIDELSTHLRKHKKDFHSRRGLLQLVADRRKHLKYLEQKNMKSYEALIKQLGLKR